MNDTPYAEVQVYANLLTGSRWVVLNGRAMPPAEARRLAGDLSRRLCEAADAAEAITG